MLKSSVIIFGGIRNCFNKSLSTARYSNKTRNIIRNRYYYRNKDGSYKEYNESITVLPEEFKDQGKFLTFI